MTSPDDINDPVLVDSIAYEEVDQNKLNEAVIIGIADGYAEHDGRDDVNANESNEDDEQDEGESPMDRDYNL